MSKPEASAPPPPPPMPSSAISSSLHAKVGPPASSAVGGMPLPSHPPAAAHPPVTKLPPAATHPPVVSQPPGNAKPPRAAPNLFWVFNPGHFKTVSGIIQTIQILLCALCVGLVGWYKYTCFNGSAGIFFLLMFTTYLIGTSTLLISSLISTPTAERLPRTVFEIIFNSIASILLVISSLVLLGDSLVYEYRSPHWEVYVAAAIIGLVTTILYCFTASFGIYKFKRRFRN